MRHHFTLLIPASLIGVVEASDGSSALYMFLLAFGFVVLAGLGWCCLNFCTCCGDDEQPRFRTQPTMEEVENRIRELEANTSDDRVEPTAPVDPSDKPGIVLPQQPGDVVSYLGDEGEPPPPSYADVMVDHAPSDDGIDCKIGFNLPKHLRKTM